MLHLAHDDGDEIGIVRRKSHRERHQVAAVTAIPHQDLDPLDGLSCRYEWCQKRTESFLPGGRDELQRLAGKIVQAIRGKRAWKLRLHFIVRCSIDNNSSVGREDT